MPDPLPQERRAAIRERYEAPHDAFRCGKECWHLAHEDVPALLAEVERLQPIEADAAALRSLAMNVLDDLEHGRVHHARQTLRQALHAPAAGGEDA